MRSTILAIICCFSCVWCSTDLDIAIGCHEYRSLDILFVLDGSASVGRHFDVVKDFVKEVAKSSFGRELHKRRIGLGVIQYSHFFPSRDWDSQKYMKTEIKIGEFRTFNAFSVAVDRIKLQNYTTHTGRALEKAAMEFKNSVRFNQTNHTQIMILVTDGKSSDPANVEPNARTLRDMGVITYAIGVADADWKELSLIATGDIRSKRRVYHIDRFDSLYDLVHLFRSILLDSACIFNSANNTEMIGREDLTTRTPPSDDTTAAVCNQHSTDLLFVLDGSGSVGTDNFKIVKDFVKRVSRPYFDGASRKTRVDIGIIQYSHFLRSRPWNEQTYMTTEIRIGEFQSFEDFSIAVDEITLHNYTTYTGHAMEKAAIEFRNSARFNETNHKQIMILITDGKSADPEYIEPNAQILRNMGVITYAVGVGPYLDRRELGFIAKGKNSSERNVYYVDNFDSLDHLEFSLENDFINCSRDAEIETTLEVAVTSATSSQAKLTTRDLEETTISTKTKASYVTATAKEDKKVPEDWIAQLLRALANQVQSTFENQQ